MKSYMHPASTVCRPVRLFDEDQAGTIEWGKEKFKRWFKLLDEYWIGPKKNYLCGNQITIADYFGSGFVSLGEIVHVDISD